MNLPDPQKWILTGFASIIAPWQDKVTKFELISSFYQPQLNLLASFLGILIGVTVLAVAKSQSKRVNTRRLVWSTGILTTLILICFGLHLTVDIVWFPDPIPATILRIAWPFFYIFANIGVATSVALSLLIFSERR